MSCRRSTAWSRASSTAAHLESAGVRVLNQPEALLAAHDKLLTAERLVAAGIPAPVDDVTLEPGQPVPECPFPCVVKPRFGSWGQDVYLCRSPRRSAGGPRRGLDDDRGGRATAH